MHAEIGNRRGREQLADRIGHRADSNLDACAARNFGRDQLGDFLIDGVRGRIFQLRHRARAALDHSVDIADMNRVLDSENVRHARVGLDDQSLRLLSDRLVICDRGAEVEKSVAVHRRSFQNGDIDADEAAIVVGRLAEIHRDVMCEAAIVHLSFESREVPGQVHDMARFGIGLDSGARAHRKASADFDALEARNPLGQRTIEEVGLSEAESVLDPIAGFHPRRGRLGADEFAFKFTVKRCRHRNQILRAAAARASMPRLKIQTIAPGAHYLGAARVAMLALAMSSGVESLV